LNNKSYATKASVIEPVGGHGGMNPYDFNLCRGLSSNGVDTALFTSDETIAPVTHEFIFRPVYRGIFGKVPNWRKAIRYAIGSITALVSSTLTGRRVCHFHFFGVRPTEFMNVVISRLLFRKVVITAHDVECFVTGHDTPGLPRRTYALAHAVIAHNQVSRIELERIMRLPPGRIHVIPAGNHLQSLPALPSQSSARTKLGLPAKGPCLLFFGQIKQVKGLDVLLDAMPAILARHPETTLVIAGNPQRLDFGVYRDQMAQLGIQDRCVTHIRYIPDEDLPYYYQACDLITLPYRKIYQSDVILMAMSCGKPVITSDIPGMLELISDDKTGYIFRSGDPDSLAARVCQALDNPGQRAEIAEAGRRLMDEKYDWTQIGKATAELYRSL